MGTCDKKSSFKIIIDYLKRNKFIKNLTQANFEFKASMKLLYQVSHEEVAILELVYHLFLQFDS